MDEFTAGNFLFLGDENSFFSDGDDNAEARFNDLTKVLEVHTNGDTVVDMEITLSNVALAILDQTFPRHRG